MSVGGTTRETPKAAPRAAFAKSVRTRSQWAAGRAVHHQVRVECANMATTLAHLSSVRPVSHLLSAGMDDRSDPVMWVP